MKRFEIGDHITVQGNKGIVTEIDRCKEIRLSYEGQDLGSHMMNDQIAEETKAKGYTLDETGRTGTYYKVDFINELKQTAYNGGWYGGIDGLVTYGEW